MPINELPLPDGVTRTPDADELLRVFINSNKNLDVVLKTGFNDAATWGTLLADVARHVANGYGELGDNPLQTLRRISESFNQDLASQLGGGAKF